mmetsp:Transcript_30894/g.95398  ORF Transcript_30894/g.95398 Transcript_30894/m.95398 type:complete len:554 (-) Transcript_30894:436-2097(-)
MQSSTACDDTRSLDAITGERASPAEAASAAPPELSPPTTPALPTEAPRPGPNRADHGVPAARRPASRGRAVQWHDAADALPPRRPPPAPSVSPRPVRGASTTGSPSGAEPFSVEAHDRMAAEISRQIGVQVSLVWFSLVTVLVSVLALTQLTIIALRVDAGVNATTPWDELLIPTFLICAVAVLAALTYFAGGVGEAQLATAGSGGGHDDEPAFATSASDADGLAASTECRRCSGGADGTATKRNKPCCCLRIQPSATDRGGLQPPPLLGTPASTMTSFSGEPEDPQVAADKATYRAWLFRAQRVACVMLVCYVVAVCAAGRLAAHPEDRTAFVSFAFGALAEFILFAARVHLVASGAMPAVVRRSEGVPEISSAGVAIIGSFKTLTPLLRLAFYCMVGFQAARIADGVPVALPWVGVFAPVFVIQIKAMVFTWTVVRAKTAAAGPEDTEARTHTIGAAVACTLLGCICFTTVTVALWLDGTLTWSLGVCLLPVMVVFLLAAGLSALLGCAVASRTVELPDTTAADAAIRGGRSAAAPTFAASSDPRFASVAV